MDVLDWCTVCNSLLDEEDLFCSNCGKSAERRQSAAPAQTEILTHHFECNGCGASMSYDASARTLRCPYCASEQLEKRDDVKAIRASKVVQFQIDHAEAHRVLTDWLGTGFWRPSDLASVATVESIAGVYVPHWVFAAETHAFWTADTSETPLGARGDWFPLSGENRSSYSGLLVGASSELSPDETEAICPFDLNSAVATDQIELENAIVEQFTVPRKYARPLARRGLEEREKQVCAQRYIPGRHRNLKVNIRIEQLRSEPLLLPVWVMAYQYRDKLYRILINGQTGKVSGDAPFSTFKAVIIASIAILIALIVLVIVAMANR